MANEETLIRILLQVEDGKLTAISAKDKIKALVVDMLPTLDEMRGMAQNRYLKGKVKHNTFKEGFVLGASEICNWIKD
jgi:hypothetical protein